MKANNQGGIIKKNQGGTRYAKCKQTPEWGGKSVKNLLKKWWFWVIIILLICMIGNDGETQSTDEITTEPQTVLQTVEVEESTVQPETTTETTAEINQTVKFIEEVTIAIQDQVGENDVILGVTLTDGDLRISIDISNNDPTPLSFSDLIYSRTVGITDAILEITEYDNEWTTITVDFGELGYIINSKDNIEQNEYGRYFQSENFVIETE